METAFAELPLALFTTLASVGAGAFVALAAVVFATAYDEEALRKIDRMAVVPLAVVLVAFVCAFFHLASPLNAFGVFAGVGSSPLSNELVAGCLFFVVALVYGILGVAGKLSVGARKGLLAVCAALAVVFAAFMGLAYLMGTIPSWDQPATVAQMLGYLLLGGTALGLVTLQLAGVLDQALEGGFRAWGLALVIVGAVLGIGGLVMQVSAVSGMANALVSGADLVAAVTSYVAVAAVCLAAAAVCAALCLVGRARAAMAWGSLVLAVVGVLLARLVFYALELSVGPLM